MKLFPFLNRGSRGFFFVMGTLLTILIALVDFLTGVEISFSIFYLIPVGLVSWYVGRTPGIVFAVIAAMAWFWADVAPGHVYASPEIPYWNAAVRFGIFLVVSFVLTQRKNAEQRVTTMMRKLEDQNRQITVLEQAGHLLQACSQATEVYDVLKSSIGNLFPEGKGALYSINTSHDRLQVEFTWGGFGVRQAFASQDCWALRSGAAHMVLEPKSAVLCKHVELTPETPCTCVPMVAYGETLGMMHLQCETLGEPQQRVFSALSEQGALALSNLRLRDVLKRQAIRDSLTGLFNRRYMEESLVREIRRAERDKSSIGLIMMDIDHFKTFNDTYGHIAGDALLEAFGIFLRSSVRGGDIACRYGGEEFLLVLPNTAIEETRKKAEDLRRRIKLISVKHQDKVLPNISVSAGISAYPSHGTEAEGLLQAADNALYHAKKSGRDRVEIEPSSVSPL